MFWSDVERATEADEQADHPEMTSVGGTFFTRLLRNRPARASSAVVERDDNLPTARKLITRSFGVFALTFAALVFAYKALA